MIFQDSCRPLPARAAPLPGESLVSLLRRTTEAMGYEGPGRIRSLVTDDEILPLNANALSQGKILDRLAKVLHRSSVDVLHRTFQRFAEALVLVRPSEGNAQVCDSKTVHKFFVTSSPPICPQCLRQDSIAYERLLWSFRPTPVCGLHLCLLVSCCPACRKSLRYDRVDVSRCTCGNLLTERAGTPVSSQVADLASQWEQLLYGRATLLPKMSTAATFWWAERLAVAAANTPIWLERFTQRMGIQAFRDTDSIAWLSAAEIVTQWPSRFEEFLGLYQQVDKHLTTSTGVNRRFGLLLREAWFLEMNGFPTPANALRHYLLQHYAAGHLTGKVCLFKGRQNQLALAQRPWITKTEAASLLRVCVGAIALLVDSGVLVGEIHPAGPHGRSVGSVLRESVESLALELSQSLNVCTAAAKLGIGRHVVLDLIHDDLLPRTVRTAKGWRIPPPSVAEWVMLCDRLPRMKVENVAWISLRQATRATALSGLAMSGLLQLIRTGSVKAQMADPKRILNGIVVSRVDLETAQREARNQTDWSLHYAAQHLFPDRPVKSDVLKKWVREGWLIARQNGRRTMISAAEIARFRAEYCLTYEAVQITGVTQSTLSRWEVQGRVTPVYGKRVSSSAGFSLYRRRDLQRLVRPAA